MLQRLKQALALATSGKWGYAGHQILAKEDGNEDGIATVKAPRDAHFIAEAKNAMPALIAAADFLADALPGVEAYASSLTDESYRSMWLNQIAKYKQALGDLGLAATPKPEVKKPQGSSRKPGM